VLEGVFMEHSLSIHYQVEPITASREDVVLERCWSRNDIDDEV
jgi:hypothetical protein